MHGWLLRCDPGTGRFEAELGIGATRSAGAAGTVTIVAGQPASTAVWEEQTRTLRLVRDRTGRQPLFHARAGRTLLASTDLRALLREPGVSSQPSPAAVAELLLERPGPPAETLFAAASRVPAGHVLTAAPRGECLARTWEPPAAGSLPAEAAVRFGAVLEAAVAGALDGRAAIFLSGGIDSTAVAVAVAAVSAARGLPPPVAACADIEGSSEAASQRTVAQGLALERIERLFHPAAGTLVRTLELAGGSLWPVDSAWGTVFEELLADARAAGCTVILDGAGGDELLDAGLGPARGFLRRGRLGALANLVRAERLYSGAGLRPVLAQLLRGGRSPAPAPLPAWVADPSLRRQLEERSAAPPPDDDLLDTFLAASTETTAERALQGGYRHVQPLLDAGVVELLRGLPPEALVRGGDPKSPARAYVRERLPVVPGRWPQPKVVGGMLDWLVASEAPGSWRALGGPRELASLGLDPFGEAAGPLESGVVWSMLCVEQWLRRQGGH